jgi:hypothetical protein
MNLGDTFISPTEPLARFPGREMRVIAVNAVGGFRWVDAVPVRPLRSDRHWHSTYQLDDEGRPMQLHSCAFHGALDEVA